MIGETIKGTYKIYEVVSKDPLVQVYMGRNLQTNEIVAVEIISKRIFDDVLGITRAEWNQRFRREMDGLTRVVSPYIARICDYGERDDTIFVVSEYVPGKSLKQSIEERGPLSVEEALEIARQIAAGLQVVQPEKLSHGDLRPSNVMLSAGGQVKLLDFGISKSFIVEGLMPRAIVAMPHYAAPEQGEGETPDVRSDIYALGVILYEMLTGKLPFTSEDPARLILKHIHEPAPSVRGAQPDTPAAVEAIIARCLAKRPDDRFQTPAELIAAIAAILSPAVAEPEPVKVAAAAAAIVEEAAAPPPAAPLPPVTPPPAPAAEEVAPPSTQPPSPPPGPEQPAAAQPAPAFPSPEPPAPAQPAPIPLRPEPAVPVQPAPRRKPSPILLGAGAAAGLLLIVLLAVSLLGGKGAQEAAVTETGAPVSATAAVSPSGTPPSATATAKPATVAPTASAATAKPATVAPTAATKPAAAAQATPTLTAVVQTATPTIRPATFTPTKTLTPTRRRVYLPLVLRKKSAK